MKTDKLKAKLFKAAGYAEPKGSIAVTSFQLVAGGCVVAIQLDSLDDSVINARAHVRSMTPDGIERLIKFMSSANEPLGTV